MFAVDYVHGTVIGYSTGHIDREQAAYHVQEADAVSANQSVSRQGTGRGICLRAATCILLIVLPIFVASTFITYFLMKNTSLGDQDHLHQYAIYAFIIFSAASVFPFALFFIVIIVEKIHSKYKTFRESMNEVSRVSEEESRSFSANIYERPLDSSLMIGSEVIVVHDGHGLQGHEVTITDFSRRRRGTLHRQEAFDFPPGYEEVAILSPRFGQEEQPPSYEMAILCPTADQGHCSFEDGQTSKSAGVKEFSFDDKPPTYDEKTMKI
ncbi:hypothetical protein HDE_04990 [Halotydeus destructor]|nr:hypothetical protein HDE_04990 [Halotydeus destructor]